MGSRASRIAVIIMRLALLLLAGAALAAAIPAQAQAGRCRPAEPPRPLRRAERVRDSIQTAIRDTLRTELLQAARDAGIAEPAGIVLVQRTDRRTGQARVWSFRSNVPDPVSRAAVARHAALLVRWPGRDARMDFRLDTVDVPDQPATECMPGLVNREQFVRDLNRLAPRFAMRPDVRPRTVVHVKMLVSREGDVAYAEVSRRSSLPELDREVLALAESLRFHPATLGDVPVDVWVEQPVEVHVPDARRERTRPE